MKLTQDEFTEYKTSYPVYTMTSQTDEIGHETATATESGSITCMWNPVEDEASYNLYGEAVKDMKMAVIYDSSTPADFDRVDIDGTMYEVTSDKKYNTHREITVRKITK